MSSSTSLNWLTIQIVPSGYWGCASYADVATVLASARTAALTGLSLDTTRIPSRIDVIGSKCEPIPITIAQNNPDGSATIRVNAPDRLWAKLSYNFAHELGHVLSGSWRADAIPDGPSHWLEEVLVEAFAVFALKEMATTWNHNPPYTHWSSYSTHLNTYADDRISELRSHINTAAFVTDGAAWFGSCCNEITSSLKVTEHLWPAIPWLIDEYMTDRTLIADLGGLNRWAERGRLPLGEYLNRWEFSANNLHLPARLPELLRRKLL